MSLDRNILETLLETAAESLLIVDRQGKIVWLNRKAESLFACNRQELLGQPVEFLVPDRFRENHVRHREKYVTSPRNRPMGAGLELSARRRDGREFPVEISLSFAGEGENLVILASITDVSIRRGEEAILRENEARCRSLVDEVLNLAPCGLVVLNTDMEIVWVNREWTDLFGLQTLGVIGQAVGPILKERIAGMMADPEDFLGRLFHDYADGIQDEGFSCRMPARNGRPERWVEIRSRTIPSGSLAGGRIDQYLDVTRLRQAGDFDESLQECRDQVRELERELRTLGRAHGSGPAPEGKKQDLADLLRTRMPALFQTLASEYRDILDEAIEKRIYRVEERHSSPMHALADRLADLDCDHHDAMEIHRAVLKKIRVEVSPQKISPYIEEGYLLLIELLGFMVSSYRNRVPAGQNPEPG